MPLPPYIHESLKENDRYQTVYAKYEGSAAAPTAGLHFTDELLKKIEEKGVKIANVTLHVGIGTFRPVKEENIEEHDMHSEHFYIKQEDVDKILKAFYLVYNTLGYGFLERVYQNALYFELIEQGFKCEVQKQINVFYKNHKVGEYYADMVINNSIILELKAADALRPEHEFQLINYLKATDIEIGYLLNFGKHPEFKRKIFSHH